VTLTEARIDGRLLRFSRVEKEMWPGFTKGDVIEYYSAVGRALLPHLRGRPVTLARFPDGIGGPAWYQTNCRGHPEWMRTAEVVGRSGQTLRYCVIEDLASLLWVADQAALELHPLMTHVDHPGRGREVAFDLDPGQPAGLPEVCRVALALRKALETRGLEAFPKTSGSKGLHVLVPVTPTSFAETKRFAREVAARLAASGPEAVTDRPAKALRRGRVFVDWGGNDPNRSLAAPYSLRAARSPVVSTPLTWDEVEAGAAGAALRFGPDEVVERLRRLGDLFGRMNDPARRLPE
jgi:bifunctional non-homologous end joining protein LigD